MIWLSILRASRKVVLIGALWVVIFIAIVSWPKIQQSLPGLNVPLGIPVQDAGSLKPLLVAGICLMVLGAGLYGWAKAKCRKIDEAAD